MKSGKRRGVRIQRALTPAAKKDLRKMARAVTGEGPCTGDAPTNHLIDRVITKAITTLKAQGIFVAVTGYATYPCGAAPVEHHMDFFKFTNGGANPHETVHMCTEVIESLRDVLNTMETELAAEVARDRATDGPTSFLQSAPRGTRQ